MPALEQIEQFTATLPASYREAFDDDIISQHLQISLRRGSQAAELGLFDTIEGERTALCVVADDRPGLLASISEALVLHGLDVTNARIYTRARADGHAEAVDLFWVRRQRHARTMRSLSSQLADAVRGTLLVILEGQGTRRPRPSVPSNMGHGFAETNVRFLEDELGAFATLEVETNDRAGLLLTIALALTGCGVQIVGSLVNTTGALVFDRFQLRELDDAPIGLGRRRQIQQAVLAALEADEPHRLPIPA